MSRRLRAARHTMRSRIAAQVTLHTRMATAIVLTILILHLVSYGGLPVEPLQVLSEKRECVSNAVTYPATVTAVAFAHVEQAFGRLGDIPRDRVHIACTVAADGGWVSFV